MKLYQCGIRLREMMQKSECIQRNIYRKNEILSNKGHGSNKLDEKIIHKNINSIKEYNLNKK